MTVTATTATLKAEVTLRMMSRRLAAFRLPALILAYLTYIFFAFDIPGLAERARMDNARLLVADSYSYKTHVTRDNRSGEVSIAIEGERKGSYPPGTAPDWVRLGDETVIDLGGGHVVTYTADGMTYEVPGFGVIEAITSRSGGVVTNLGDAVPDWINASDNRVAITTEAGRVTITRNRTEVFRYSLGWELFFFTLDSPYHGEGLAAILFGPQIDPTRDNLQGAWQDFWGNQMWRHSEVAWAIFETILMAFLGTMGAALVALPLAFLAARNFTPFMIVRFAVRRVFDFVRGVDALIWTIVLARAFGPGPLTGALAILVTDSGSFGKMFSEALENVDRRQIEGVQSTGAPTLARYRFGVIPQITPILLSQVLYYLESNTRSATIIGAITGGGIGLMLTQAIITQKDWEEVSYYITLILIMVTLMDWLSGILRRRLIKGA
ncbi:phosphonate ABC transporter, permease protein PhnE [Rhodovulum steppense]|uniref:Phosphonate transport system permease protein n=1 Tax=Rhodovulum steppense TaxID=540251 RepID=A0A4R1YNV2_9RHOB|nr:phosphonate ABC transporter, permease protein PhnE [Rhodovulum steppense]TCM79281.1 phosphonate transport system permease protein [Rhodovulum steppense]